jgi:DNA-binding response OmpR family regulator
VVDDDKNILEAISLILEEASHYVDTAISGDEAYKKISRKNPDLILLDVLLGGSDGRLICQALKSSIKTKKIPIIMISAHPSAKYTIKKYGADEFLAKPFGMDQLLTTIAKYTA